MRKLLILLRNIISFPIRMLFSNVAIFSIIQKCVIDKTAAICSGVRFYRGSIGKYSYIGGNSFVIDSKIENFTSIGPDCYIGGTSHPTEWVSTSPVFHRWKNILKKNFATHEFEIFKPTHIGNDVWIGTRVMVKAGVNIADGAVIGMGSVVTHDIGPYEIWAGNPARFIIKRFDDKTIIKMLSIRWWNYDEKTIEKFAGDFNNIEMFISKIEYETKNLQSKRS